MVGGIVIETIVKADRVWVNCVDLDEKRNDKCAQYVERNDKSEKIKPGDSFWWQSGYAFWTPYNNLPQHHTIDQFSRRKSGIDYDIRIPRIGFSGVSRPKV